MLEVILSVRWTPFHLVWRAWLCVSRHVCVLWGDASVRKRLKLSILIPVEFCSCKAFFLYEKSSPPKEWDVSFQPSSTEVADLWKLSQNRNICQLSIMDTSARCSGFLKIKARRYTLAHCNVSTAVGCWEIYPEKQSVMIKGRASLLQPSVILSWPVATLHAPKT